MNARARFAAIFGCATAMAAVDAAANDAYSLFVAGNVAALCRDQGGGKRYVDPDELFDLMLDRAETPHAYRKAGRNAVMPVSKKGTPLTAQEEKALRLKFARHISILTPAPPAPFGPDDGGAMYRAVVSKWNEQVEKLDDDLSNLQATGKHPFLRTGSGAAPAPKDVFVETQPPIIICAVPGVALSPAGKTGEKFDPFEHVRVASTKKGMGLLDGNARRAPDTLKKVDAAKVSYRDDFENDASVFSIDGVVGIQIPLTDPNVDKTQRAYINLLPYVAYKRQEPGGGAKVEDIHRAAPGLMLSYRQFVGWMPFELFLSGESLFDIEQHSEQLVADVSFSPAFAIDDDGTALFAEPIGLGLINVYPDLDASARFAEVLDAGRNSDLETGSGYLGLGGEASVRFSLNQPAALTPFALKFGYEHLEFVAGDIDRDRARRLDIELTYAFPDFPNLTATIGYKSGQDMSSYQNEDALQLSIGLRY